MRIDDFKRYLIRNFTPAEIEATGAALEDVRWETLQMLQAFRDSMKRAVILLPNGLTSGDHSSPQHPLGLAVDVGFREKDGKVPPVLIFKSALIAGAKGIGIYWNGFAYSVHLDLRNEYAFWAGVKGHRQKAWNYRPLINDPKFLG